MGSHVQQTSELVDIRAALKRAADKATRGTREERSGRFLPTDKRGSLSLDDRSKVGTGFPSAIATKTKK